MRYSKDKRILGRLELRIMNVLWTDGASTCRHVYTVLGGHRAYAYNTILSMMRHLEKKDLVTHTEEGRSYLYTASVHREEIEHHMLSDFLTSVFNGSPLDLVNALLGSGGVTARDLEEIEAVIERSRRGGGT